MKQLIVGVALACVAVAADSPKDYDDRTTMAKVIAIPTRGTMIFARIVLFLFCVLMKVEHFIRRAPPPQLCSSSFQCEPAAVLI